MKKLFIMLVLALSVSTVSAEISKANTANATLIPSVFGHGGYQQCVSNCRAHAVDDCIARGGLPAICEGVAVEVCIVNCQRNIIGFAF
jgi:hypothetical protein